METQKRLKLSLHSYISSLSYNITPQALLCITEFIFELLMAKGQDLYWFTKHAKRSVLGLDDIKLLLRRNPKVFSMLVDNTSSTKGSKEY